MKRKKKQRKNWKGTLSVMLSTTMALGTPVQVLGANSADSALDESGGGTRTYGRLLSGSVELYPSAYC